MKIRLLLIAAFLLAGTTVLLSQEVTEKFKVYGNCGMCKKTIEKSLKDVEGMSSAKWNAETKMIKVKYDEGVIALADIKKIIAGVGYDSEEARAEDEVYSKLHKCCQYDRPDKK